MLRATIGLFFALAFAGASITWLAARDFRVDEVAAVDGKINCFAHRKYLVTQTSGPCDTFTPPAKVRLGESFSADGKARRINVIIANQADKDIDLRPHRSDFIKKGELTCTAAETVDDLPSDKERNRTWLYIRKCRLSE